MKKTLLCITLATIFVLSSIVTAPSQKLVDEFNYGNAEESMSRLDSYFIELQKAPDSRGFIIFYGPKTTKRGEFEAHIKQIPEYFKFRRFPAERVTLVNGGYRDSERVTLAFWVAAPGDKLPEASGTIDAKDVKILKSKFSRKSLYFCC